MAEDQVYDACLEVHPGGECVAQLCDLPACFARGADETRALAALESSIPAYFAWLARHDEYTPVMQGSFRAVAAETLQMPTAEAGVFFESDASPLSADDLDWYASLLDWSYQDFEASLGANGAGSGTAIVQGANQLCAAQAWLLSRAAEAQGDGVPPLPRLLPAQLVAHIHHATLDQARAATSEDRTRVQDLEGERWSLRKVLRRSIFLVREATQEFAQ